MSFNRRIKAAFICLVPLLLCLSLLLGQATAFAENRQHSGVRGIIKYSGEFCDSPATVWDIFDPWYYISNNSGVSTAGLSARTLNGSDIEALYREYMEIGLAAGQSCSPWLNLPAYRRCYPDLNARFGDNWDSYVEYYFSTGQWEGQSDGTCAGDAFIREVLASIAEQGLKGDAFTAQLLALYPDYDIRPAQKNKANGNSSHDGTPDAAVNPDSFPPVDKDDPDPDDKPIGIINHTARENLTGYRLYGDVNATEPVEIDNGIFKGYFYPDTYQSIMNNPALKQEARDYTVMVYLCGTDLEKNQRLATRDLIDMLKSQYDVNKVNVLVLAGGTLSWSSAAMQAKNNGVNCCLYYLNPDAVEIPADADSFWSLDNCDRILTADSADGEAGSLRLLANFGQVDMGDSELLLGFMDAACELFPAGHYWLSLWNHGSGAASGVCSSAAVTAEENEEYYQGVDIKGKSLSLGRIEEALHSSRICREMGGLDIVSLDACLMGGLEMAYNLSPYADYMTASEEVTNGLVGYCEYLSPFQKDAGDSPTPRALAVHLAKGFMDAHTEYAADIATNSCIDLKALRDYDRQMEAFGGAMSTLMNSPATSENTFRAVYGAAVRSVSFGTFSAPIAVCRGNYIDLYGFLNNLYGLLGAQAQSAFEAGDMDCADLYTDAMKSISALYESRFILYRGMKYPELYGVDQTASQDGAMSIVNTREDALNLWQAGNYGSVCGVSIFLPFKQTGEEESSNRQYVDESIFPAYAEFVNSFYNMLQDRYDQLKSEAEAIAANEPDRMFSGISTERYDWVDDAGQAHSDLLVNVRFNDKEDVDMAAAFSQTHMKDFRMVVMRRDRVRDRDTGEEQLVDLVISRSKEKTSYPINYLSGGVTSVEDEDGRLITKDDSGLTIDTQLLSFIAYYVTGSTPETQEGQRAADWGTPSDFADYSIQQYREQAGEEETKYASVAGVIHYRGEDGTDQTRDVDLIFSQNEDSLFTYVGAICIETVQGDTEDDEEEKVSILKPDNAQIELYHYMIKDHQIVRVEDLCDTDRPSYVIADGVPAPTLRAIDVSKIDPDHNYDTDYNKYGIEFSSPVQSIYYETGSEAYSGCVNGEAYEGNPGIGAIVDADEPENTHGVNPKTESPPDSEAPKQTHPNDNAGPMDEEAEESAQEGSTEDVIENIPYDDTTDDTFNSSPDQSIENIPYDDTTDDTFNSSPDQSIENIPYDNTTDDTFSSSPDQSIENIPYVDTTDNTFNSSPDQSIEILP